MQCNMELNEDKSQWHVSISSALLEALGQTCPLFPSGVWRGNGLVSASSLWYPKLSCPLTIKKPKEPSHRPLWLKGRKILMSLSGHPLTPLLSSPAVTGWL